MVGNNYLELMYLHHSFSTFDFNHIDNRILDFDQDLQDVGYFFQDKVSHPVPSPYIQIYHDNGNR